MRYYVKNNETGDKFIVAGPSVKGNAYILASVRSKIMIKVTEEHFLKDFKFDGLID